MGRLFAAVYDRMIAASEEACVGEWRAQLLAGLTGDVLELGAGTGLNLARYPTAVGRLVLVEPDRHRRTKLVARVDEVAPPFPVEVVDAGAERLPFDDATFDAVVSTLVLCSVPYPAAAVAEARRVLRPGGRLVFLEHVLADADKPRRRAWQRRIEPLWKRAAGGCHLTRDTLAVIEAAGFEVEHRRESMCKANALVRTTERGEARVPA